ncbi:MAG: DEAD/DEAH box helicase [Bacteroidales bacterium]|nr:DEAD/DEAH box helicase [Bacteroidales bacterium]
MESPLGTDEQLFSLVVTKNRIWGNIIIPCILKKIKGKEYFTISESLFPFPSEEIVTSLFPEERETVEILNQYSDRQLFKLFSKERNVKDFLLNVTPDIINRHIRPYIEKSLYKCVEIARDESIPIFIKRSSIKSFHSDDKLEIITEPVLPIFRFERNAIQSTYSLSLELEDKHLDIRNNQTEILCNNPCVIICGNKLVFVSEIDAAKLRPFITKEFLIIPKISEKKYFSTFVLSVINRFRTETSGFRIEYPLSDKKVYLDIEQELRGYPSAILRFNYSGTFFYHTEKERAITKFEDNNGEFIFRKYTRDFEWEKNCIKILNDADFYSEDDISFTISNITGNYDTDLYNTIEAINNSYDELTSLGFIINSDKLEKKYNLYPVKIFTDHNVEGDWFDLKSIVKIGEYEFPFVRLKSYILSGTREFELPDKTTAILPEVWFSKYRSIFEFGKVHGNILKIHKQHFSIISEAFSDKESIAGYQLDKFLTPEFIPEHILPAGLTTELRKYQIDGVNWMVWLQSAGLGGCLADDMGLGKTIQTLALLVFNKENSARLKIAEINHSEPTLFDQQIQNPVSLIIVPASIIYNWENEIRKFAPTLKIYSYKGSQRNKNIFSYFNYFDIILSSYHIVRQDIDVLSEFHFHYIILDESQAIKNPSSMIFKTVSTLKSSYRLVLTGTPMENSLIDLWTQLSFVNPGLLGSIAFFKREYVTPIEKHRNIEKEQKLKKIIKPFILRRTKEMVASDLPSVSEHTVYCDMTEEQTEIYEREKSVVRNTIMRKMEASDNEKSVILILRGLMKLRQISNHPSLIIEEYTGGSGKFETVIRDLENIIAENHKILVFSSFVKHLSLYSDYLSKNEINFSILTGASRNRDRIINDFQKDPSNKIFLISLKAGGLGLNLTAADYVFILDPWWNPAAELQAMSRAHRIGQDKNVFVFRYISTDSIEEKIVKLQDKKSKLADTFIQSNNPLKDIDYKNILEIIG